MTLNYDQLQRSIVNLVNENNAWDRVVSVDIEADLETLQDPNKPILNISAARRVDGKIDIQNFILNEETQDEEIGVFNKFGDYCQEVRPLMLVGYGIGRFDFPLMLLKMRVLDDLFKKDGRYQPGYWAFRDVMTRAYVLDVINPLRFEVGRHDNTRPRFISLEKAIGHERFKHLPFRSSKDIVSSKVSESNNKWDVVRDMWKNDRESFTKYAEGDVHDTLLLAEDLFGVK